MASVNQNLLDLAIKHQIGLSRYSTSTVRKIIGLLNNADAHLVEQIKRFDPSEVDGSWSQKRLEKMLEAIRIVNAEAFDAVNGQTKSELKDLSGYEGEFTAKQMRLTIPIEMNIVTPTASQLYAAVESRPFSGKLLKEWGSELEEGAFKRVRDTVRQGYVQGRTTDQIVREVIGTKSANYSDGIVDVSRRSAEMMVRTSINHTSNTSRQETYQANSDLVDKWRFVATLDSRTTVTCASLDGKTFDISSGPMPPLHPNCRSTSVPVIKSWQDLGFDIEDLPPVERASMDGQVPGTETYNSWLQKQDESFQDDVLGATRGKLYRDGGLALDRFTDRMGVEYTLDELRSREAAAFERLGL